MVKYEVLYSYTAEDGTTVTLRLYRADAWNVSDEYRVVVEGNEQLDIEVGVSDRDLAMDMYNSWVRITKLTNSIDRLLGDMNALQQRYSAAGV